MIKVFFIGLGVMGGSMASHLVKSGYDVMVYNRTKSKAQAWLEKNTSATLSTLDDAIPHADIIISCVGNDDDLNQLAFDTNGIMALAKPNTIWIDHTTSSSKIAQNIHSQLKDKQIVFYDAPVSGGEIGAINGTLTVMLGGDEERLDEVQDILSAYALHVTHIGESGSGQLTKMVNQICLSGILQGLSEGLSFAENNQLNVLRVLEAISKGAAQSWQMDNRAKTMHNQKFDFGFAIDLMLKDLNICFEQAKASNSALPMTEFIKKCYQTLQQQGYGKEDTSALIRQFYDA
jgi:3-hydroxyisobutyrate dehydrogenase/2-hydroxy-3-oxopropionate reductase